MNSIFESLILIILGFLTCKLILYKLIPIAKKNILDIPNERSSHKKETPTSGGISFIIVGLIYGIISNDYLILFCLPLAFISFLDDIKDINQKIRLFFQVITSAFLIINYANIGLISDSLAKNILIFCVLVIF